MSVKVFRNCHKIYVVMASGNAMGKKEVTFYTGVSMSLVPVAVYSQN